MKINLILTLFTILLVGCARADYTGIVSSERHFPRGGEVVDLDGAYPSEKMALYISAKDAAAVGALPPVGAKVAAVGPVTDYNGKPEIKIHTKDQWSWK